VLLVVGFDPVAIPGRGPVPADAPVGTRALQRLECNAEPAQEFGARHFAELRLGIVQVVDVDALDTELAGAAVDLVLEKAWRQRVAAGDDVVGLQNAAAEERLLDVRTRVVRAPAVEGEVAALGAEQDPVALLPAFAQVRPHGALAALIAIVDRRVDDVQAELERAADGRGIERVGLRIVAAQIRADAEGGQPEAFRLAEMPWRRGRCLAEPRRAFGCRSPGEHSEEHPSGSVPGSTHALAQAYGSHRDSGCADEREPAKDAPSAQLPRCDP